MGRGIKEIATIEEMKEERERRSKKENYISCSEKISFPPLCAFVLPCPTTTTASSFFHEIQPCCPFASFQEPSLLPSTFSTSTYTINDCTPTRPARPDGKTNARKYRRRGWIALCASSPSRIYEILLPREGDLGVLARRGKAEIANRMRFFHVRFDDGSPRVNWTEWRIDFPRRVEYFEYYSWIIFNSVFCSSSRWKVKFIYIYIYRDVRFFQLLFYLSSFKIIFCM